jgi:hypothetical protein
MMAKDEKAAISLLEYETKNGFNKIEKIKNYILEHCTKNNKLLKDDNYIKLINYVME